MRATLAVTAALTFLAVALISLAPRGAGSAVVGDADCSGGVDARDALFILRGEADLGHVPCSGDVDCDEDSDHADTFAILRYLGDLERSVVVSSICAPIGSSGTPTSPASLPLAQLIDANDRDAIRVWAAAHTIAEINAEVAALDEPHRFALPEVVLESNASPEQRETLLAVMRDILSRNLMGFYAEIWSYTYIEFVGDGFFGSCGHVWLSPGAFGSLSQNDARGVFMHESFHSFGCTNSGPVGALDEGAAIWVVQAAYPEDLMPANSWAETTYGTKLFYRDIQGNPDYPMWAVSTPTQKLIDVYEWLESQDPSGLPWNSQERLDYCFEMYFEPLDRNVDFFNVWLPAVLAATQAMQADPFCEPI
jgi:hypothetical protein